MPPLVLIEEDEVLEFSVGDAPLPGEPDDRTVLLFRRILLSERQDLYGMFLERGQLDQRGLDCATIATGLVGWRNLWGRNGELAWPMDDDRVTQRKTVLGVIERLPEAIGTALAHQMRDPSPESLLGNWKRHWIGNNALPVPPLGSAIPVASAARNAESLVSALPVMTGD